MTVIRPNSISGITSITAQANEINVFRSNGLIAGLNLNGVNFNTTAGISTLAALKVTGNVDVAGVLTYQDVTNVDSVGIITARSTIDAQGDVSIADKIIHTGDTNTAIRFPVGDVISAETNGAERLRITSAGTLLLGTSTGALANGNGIVIADATAARLSLKDTTNGVTGTDGFDVVQTGTDAYLYHRENGNMIFGTNATERLRIDSSGRVLIGTTTEGYSGGDDLTISTSGDTGMTIRSGTSNQGTIAFSDATSGADEYRGYIQYLHNGDALLFGTASTERLRIASNGKIGINIAGSDNTSPVRNLDIADASGAIIRLVSTDDSAGANDRVGEIEFYTNDDDAAHVSSNIKAIQDPSDAYGRRGALIFGTRSDSGDATEKMRIDHSGKVGINQTDIDADLHIATKGSSEEDGTLKIGGSENSLGLLLSYDQAGATVSKITANPTYTHGSALLKICVDGDANADQLVLAGNGKIGINIADNTAADLQVRSGTNGAGVFRLGGSSGNGIGMDVTYSNSGATSTTFKQNYRSTNAGALIKFDSGHFTFHTGTGGDQLVEFASGGGIGFFHTTTSLYGAQAANSKGFYYDKGTASAQSSSPRNTGWSSYYINKHNGNGGSESRYIDFWEDANQRGNITLSGSGINYGSNSDYRLKKDDVAMTDGIARIKQLRPIKYKWIEGNIDDEGFFAHEAQAVVPVAVEGTKDQVVLQSEVDAGTQREDRSAGEPIYQTMDNSKLVPVLTASIKELITKVETLEAKVSALEGS